MLLTQQLHVIAPLMFVSLATCAPSPTADVRQAMPKQRTIGVNGETITCNELSARLSIPAALGERICDSDMPLDGLLWFAFRTRDGSGPTASTPMYDVDVVLQLHGEPARTLFETFGPSRFSTSGQARLTCEAREKGNVGCVKAQRGDYFCNIILNAATGEARRPRMCD